MMRHLNSSKPDPLRFTIPFGSSINFRQPDSLTLPDLTRYRATLKSHTIRDEDLSDTSPSDLLVATRHMESIAKEVRRRLDDANVLLEEEIDGGKKSGANRRSNTIPGNVRAKALELLEWVDREVALYSEFINRGSDLDLDAILQDESGPMDFDGNSMDGSSPFLSGPPSVLNSESGLMSPMTRIESVFPASVPDDGFVLDQQALDLVDESGSSGNPLFRWVQLQRISHHLYSPESRENIGFPTALAVSRAIVFGTSRGLVLVFDFKQKLTWRLGNPAISVQHGGITSVAISADGVWAAAGFSKGLIMVWELKTGRSIVTILPKSHAPPNLFKGAAARSTHAPGNPISSLKFAGNRRRLISTDPMGVSLIHSLSSSILGTSCTARSLFKHASKLPDPILCQEPLPNTGSRHYHEKAGLLVTVTLRTLTLFQTRPKLEILAKLERSHLESGMSAQLGSGHGDFYQHGGASASASWCHLTREHPFGAESLLLAVGWGSYLSILKVNVKEKAVVDLLELGHASCESSIVEVFWINPRNLVVLDHRDIMYMYDIEDLTSPTTIGPYTQWQPIASNSQPANGTKIHPSINHSTHAYKGNIYVLGWNAVFLGMPISWLDHVMGLVRDLNPVGAIGLATQYLREGAPFYFCQLPEEAGERAGVIKGQLQELIIASQRVLTERWRAPSSALGPEAGEFVRVCMEACIEMDSLDLLFQEVYEGNKEAGLLAPFFAQLKRILLRPTPTTIDLVDHMPPSVIKEMLMYFRSSPDHIPQLEQVLFRLNPGLVDLNYAIETCRDLKLLDGLIYLWSFALHDFISPVMEVFNVWSNPPPWDHSYDGEPTSPTASPESRLAKKLMDFLLASADGKSFPARQPLAPATAELARAQLTDLVTSKSYVQLPYSSNSRLELPFVSQAQYPYFDFLLAIDARRFTRILGKLFQDPSPDSQAQFAAPCIHILSLDSPPSVELCIFVSQSTLDLDSSTLDRTMDRLLLSYEPESFSRQEAAITSLLSSRDPSIYKDIHSRLERAGFFRPLYDLFEKSGQFRDALVVCFKCPTLYNLLFDSIRALPKDMDIKDIEEVRNLIRTNFQALVQVDPQNSICIAEEWLGADHDGICVGLSRSPDAQFKYMRTLLTPVPQEIGQTTLHLYLDLLCQNDPHNVLPFLKSIQDARGFSSVDCIPITQRYAVVDATVWLLEQTGDIDAAMTEILVVMDRKVHAIAAATSHPNDLGDALRIQGVAEIAIGLCERTHLKYSLASSNKDNFQESEQLYARLLGTVIEHYKFLSLTKETLAQEIFPTLIQTIFNSILRPPSTTSTTASISVPKILSDLIHRTTSRPEFGEFRGIILGIIATCQTESGWFDLTSKLQSQDLFGLVKTEYQLRSRGRRGFAPRCLKCRGRLVNPPTTSTSTAGEASGILMFSCGHLVHKGCHDAFNSNKNNPNQCPKCHRHSI